MDQRRAKIIIRPTILAVKNARWPLDPSAGVIFFISLHRILISAGGLNVVELFIYYVLCSLRNFS